jgi:drug/metabolite transporter (DMT)-like permease
MPYLGELAALGAVLCWTLGSQCVEAASLKAGAQAVNFVRLIFGLIALAIILLITDGVALPVGFGHDAWKLLLLSGFIGLFLGDVCLFQAFVEIGPRNAMLLMTLNAPMTAVLGMLFLGETYTALQWSGIAIAMAGIAWVIRDHDEAGAEKSGRRLRPITTRGVLLGLGAAVGQAVGLTFASKGMGEHNPLAATQIRIVAAILALGLSLALLKKTDGIKIIFSDRKVLGMTLFAGSFGTGVGVGLSMLAIQHTDTGIAATIMATVPITLIPFALFLHKEHVSSRAIVATIIAVAGVAMLVM